MTTTLSPQPGTGSSPSWERVHTRSASVRGVVAGLDAGHPLPQHADGFADQDDLLLALHGVWSRRLGGRIDLALETDDHDLAESIGQAWLATADDLPGVRRVLDEHADRLVLRRARQGEERAIAVAAGLATFDDPLGSSAAAGARHLSGLRSRAALPAARPRWWRRLAG